VVLDPALQLLDPGTQSAEELVVSISMGFDGRIRNMGFVPTHALYLWSSTHPDLSSCRGRYFEHTRLLGKMLYVK
jgi:hypothetical protein